jgi:hypothetical protein
MINKEWHWMNDKEGINQGKSPQQVEASYYGAFIGFIGMVILIIGTLVWEWIKS